jgi:hypothetical protein
MPELISQRKFADLVQVSEASIRKAIEKGYIVQGSVTKENGSKAIDYVVALAEWNNSPAGIKAAGKGLPASRYISKKESKDPAGKKETTTPFKTPAFDPAAAAAKKEIIDIKLNSEKIRHARDQFELQKQVGNFVDRKKTDEALFEYGKQFRENMENMPARYTSLIRGAATDSEAEDIFMGAVHEALRAWSTPPDLTAY